MIEKVNQIEDLESLLSKSIRERINETNLKLDLITKIQVQEQDQINMII